MARSSLFCLLLSSFFSLIAPSIQFIIIMIIIITITIIILLFLSNNITRRDLYTQLVRPCIIVFISNQKVRVNITPVNSQRLILVLISLLAGNTGDVA